MLQRPPLEWLCLHHLVQEPGPPPIPPHPLTPPRASPPRPLELRINLRLPLGGQDTVLPLVLRLWGRDLRFKSQFARRWPRLLFGSKTVTPLPSLGARLALVMQRYKSRLLASKTLPVASPRSQDQRPPHNGLPLPGEGVNGDLSPPLRPSLSPLPLNRRILMREAAPLRHRLHHHLHASSCMGEAGATAEQRRLLYITKTKEREGGSVCLSIEEAHTGKVLELCNYSNQQTSPWTSLAPLTSQTNQLADRPPHQ
jgi:hypothetical protein